MKKKNLIAAIVLCALAWPQISLAQFVFRITGNGLKEPSYIIGTAHNLDGSLLDSIPEYQEAVGHCRQLYTEIDPNGKTIKNYLKDNETLYDELPDSTDIFKFIDEWISTKRPSVSSNETTEDDLNLSVLLKERMLQELNINLDDSITKPMWNKSPFFFYDALKNYIKEKVKHQFSPCEIIDFAIIRQAHERGWKVGELDEPDFLPLTFLKLERVTLDLQMRMLKSILTHFEEYEQREKTDCINKKYSNV